MATLMSTSAAYRRNLLHIVKGPSLRLPTATQGPVIPVGKERRVNNQRLATLEFSTKADAADKAIKWLRRKILALLGVAGLAGATVFVVS